MIFTSLEYLIFLAAAFLIYFVLGQRMRIIWLLGCSYYFYGCWNPKYALLMLFSTLITYLSGLFIGKSKTVREKKLYVFLSFFVNLAILFIFKYYSFSIGALNQIFALQIPQTLNLLLPVGISFYTFQALSYTVDVYRSDVEVEKNFFRYAVFVSFFPQLVAGPIEKSKDLLKQFYVKQPFSWENFHRGCLMVGIGFFYKLVIADRAAMVVNRVYNDLDSYIEGGGIYLIIATVLFAIQIYFDFHAYSTIAKGSALMMGYQLSQNFKKPYFAVSIKDFWRRWHVSLSSWFKEYLYFPLGGSRKGFWRTQLNLIIVFLVSGLWHGAAWTFVAWGALHGIYQIIENLIQRKRKEKPSASFIKNLICIGGTFCLVDFAWIFFRANSLKDALKVIGNLFDFGMPISGELLGFGMVEAIILAVACLAVFLLEAFSEKWNLLDFLYKRNIAVRYVFYYILIFAIIIFGVYGPGFDAQEFIYFQF